MEYFFSAFGIGFGLGIWFSIWILGIHYDAIMKQTIDEIHRQYINALEIMKEKYQKEN